MAAPDEPTQIGRFTILQPLGEGGMGKVYLANDPTMDRQVAIKTIHASHHSSPKMRERFLREAKAAGLLSHPNLVTVHEFIEWGEELYLVMEHLPGLDLSVHLARRSLTPAEALEVMAQICDGLAYAHSKGVLHRDVKPTNVRVQRLHGQLHVKLMDFGVAQLPGSSFTATGDLVGTFNYMAPEYLRSGEAHVKGDLYAVGMMLHEALTGELPSMAPSLPGAQPLDVPASRPTLEGISPRTWEVVEKALAPASRRFDSAQELASALRAAAHPQWGGLEEHALPRLKSVADAQHPLSPRPHPPLARKAFEPILRPEAGIPSRGAWWPWALLLVGGVAGAWWWRREVSSPQSLTTVQPSPAPSSPAPSPAAPLPSQTPAPVMTSPPPPRTSSGPPPEPPRPQPSEPEPSQALRTLDGLRDRVREQPREAYEAAQAVLREQPQHPLAHAVALTSSYWLQRPRDMLAALDEAQRQGVDAHRLGAWECVRQMMMNERQNHLMPREVMERVRAFLPPPPDGRPRQDEPRERP